MPESVQALIAARLDTLSPERKSLLQDAAVVGKVFWAGALAEMGDRDLREVELALHELARKELVRPARTSSMEGESRVRVLACCWSATCPTARSRAPAGPPATGAAAVWLERKAGERVEDLADVLAYHYRPRSSSPRQPATASRRPSWLSPARRFLALAGERALGLDTAQAEAKLARALELIPADDPERPGLLVRWAEAVSQAGRLREAADALEQALASFRTGGDNEAAGAGADPARSRRRDGWATAATSRSPPRRSACSRRSWPGATLVAAHTQLASAQYVAGSLCGGDRRPPTRRLTIAAELGLPMPARALGLRGLARAYLGDPDGLTEMERALALMIEQGAGRDAAVFAEQPRASPGSPEGPAGCARRLRARHRLLRAARHHRDTRSPRSADRPEPARRQRPRRARRSAEAGHARSRRRDRGDIPLLIESRCLAARLPTQRDKHKHDAAGRADWLLDDRPRIAQLRR